MPWLVVCDILQDKITIEKMSHSYSSCGIVLQPKIILHVTVLQDKEMAIPHEDLGRSITTVQVLQRKHEAFERELSALGSKVGENKLCIW